MGSYICRTLFALIIVLAAAEALAAAAPEGPSAEHGAADAAQPLKWLKSGDYAALDRYYTNIQGDYEAGRASERDLYDEFHKLYDEDDADQQYFNGWVAAFPRSYVALLARGSYFYRVASFARGDKSLDRTSRKRIAAMGNYLDRAEPDLTASEKLTDKPYLTTLYLLDVNILDGSADQRRHWFERGTAIEPANWHLRERYMFSLRPRWGGSYQQMQAFLRDCEQLHLDPALLAKLALLIHADLAEDAMRADENGRVGANVEVFNEWEKVLNLAKVAGEEPSTEALVGYTRTAWDLHRRSAADRGLEQLAKRQIDDSWSLTRVGYVLAQEHRYAEAWPLLLKSASLNDPWAQFAVGKTIYKGASDLNVPADRDKGILWITRAADQCFPEAIAFLSDREHITARGCNPARINNLSSQLNPAWARAIQWGAWAVTMSLVMGWLARNRTRPRQLQDSRLLYHPTSTLIVGLVGFTFFIGIAIVSNVYHNRTTTFLTTAIFCTFALVSVPVILDYFFARHELTSDGLSFGRMNGARGSLEWSRVCRVHYSPLAKWFRIETDDGQVARISALLIGLPEFARAVLCGVHQSAIDPNTTAILQATADGELPRVWG